MEKINSYLYGVDKMRNHFVETEKTNKSIRVYKIFKKHQIRHNLLFVWNDELIPIYNDEKMQGKYGICCSVTKHSQRKDLNGMYECTGKYIKQGFNRLYEIKVSCWSTWLLNYVCAFPYNKKRATIYVPKHYMLTIKFNESLKGHSISYKNSTCICTGKETDKLIEVGFHGFIEKSKIKQIQ
jgi:hypothetical protein